MHLPPLHHLSDGWRRTLWFLAALLSGGVIFAAFGLWGLRTFSSPKTAPADREPLAPYSFDREAEPPYYLLIISAQSQIADGFLVLTMQAAGTLTVTAIPPETDIPVGTDSTTLQSIYGLGERENVQQACAALAALLRIPLTKYAVLSDQSIPAFLQYFDQNPVFTVPEAVRYEGHHPLRLESGRQTLSATQIQGLLLCPPTAWSGGRRQYTAVRGALLCAFCNQFAVAERTADVQGDFSALVNTAALHNLSISDFHTVRDTVTALMMQNRGTLCTHAVLDGEFVGRGDNVRFYPLGR